MQEQLKELDHSGDGHLDASEVLAGIQALNREKQKSKRLIWLSFALLAFSVLLLVAMFGLIYQVVEMTKESRVDPSGIMMVKGSNVPVQVRSEDAYIVVLRTHT